MKLYRKQLNSLEELRKEKQKLKAKLKDDPFSPQPQKVKLVDEVDDKVNDGAPDILSNITDMLSSPQVKDVLGAVGMPLLSLVGGQFKKKVLFNIGKELLGGYVKWKAVELGYKAVSAYMKKQKTKKQAEKAAAKV